MVKPLLFGVSLIDDSTSLETLTQRLGLSAVGSRCYVALLVNGPLQVSQLATIVSSSSDIVSKELELPLALGLVARSRHKRRIALYATNPDFAFLSLSAQLVWRSKATLAPIRSLPQTDIPGVERTRSLYSDIASVARRLYKPQTSARSHKELDAETREELGHLTCEIISVAEKRIRALSRTPRLPHLAPFWTALTERMAAGVTYTRIADLDEFVDHGLSIKRRDMAENGVELFLIEAHLVTQSFYVIDSRYLSTTHQTDRPHLQYHGVGRITTQRTVVDRYRQRFDRMLLEAIPGRFVIAELLAAADRLLERAQGILDQQEARWLQDLVDFGQFSTFQKTAGWSIDRVADVARRASAAQLVHRNQADQWVPNYAISEADIRNAFARSTAR